MIYGGFAVIVDERGSGTTGYVDGCLTPVATDARAAYTDFAAQSARLFVEHGAVRVVECWGDDVPTGTHTDFPRAVALEPGEVVAYSWIEWPSRAARDAGWGAIMADPRMAGREMPFDGQRMLYGGFTPIFDQSMGAGK
nr:DUF1428 domain-containing protein [Sphingomonas hankookensis]